MQQLFGNGGYSVEMLGIALAALSFTGASDKIERTLNKLRDWIRSYTPILRGGLGDLLPTPRNFIRSGGTALWAGFITVCVIALAFLMESSETRQSLYDVYALFLPWVWWKIALLGIFAVPALYLAATLITFVVGTVLYIALSVVWAAFWALSRPPSGIMGSVGLLVAVLPPTIKFLGIA